MNERLKITYRTIPLSMFHGIKAFLLLFLFSTTGAFAQTTVNSLSALRPYLDQSNVNIKLNPGVYSLSASDVASGVWGNYTGDLNSKSPVMLFTGSNSTYDFSGVTIMFDTDIFWAFGNTQVYELNIIGNNNVLKNLTIIDDGSVDDAPQNSIINIVIDGIGNTVEGFDVSSTGSYPYAYGDAFGKGGGPIISHRKHSAILIRGNSNTLRNTNLVHKAYGHCVVFQGAQDPLVEGCYIEGEVRRTDDMLTETSGPAFDVDFMTRYGVRLPAGYTKALCEDGLRAYGNGVTVKNGVVVTQNTTNITLKNNTVKNARNGCHMTFGGGTTHIENITLIGCELGFSPGNNTLINCSADCTYGPVYYNHYANSSSGVQGDITILDPVGPYHNGNGVAAFFGGNESANINLHGDLDGLASGLVIKVGGNSGNLFDIGEADQEGSNKTINNNTNFPVVINALSTNNTISSCGSVTNSGSGNSISTASNCPTVGANNIAFGKTASQSSNLSITSGLAHEAVDGNTNGNWNNGSVTHTQPNTSNPWWEVDLGSNYDIDEIVIYNRTNNCCRSRLSNFTVSILDGNTATFSQTFSSYPDPSLTINAGNASGDVIRVQINGTGTLSLAEVEAYGELSSVVGGDFRLVKRNSTGFAIDGGGNNGAEGRSVELYTYLQHNNLTWTEISRGGGYYSYQKRNSNVCFDGGDGGGNGQDVTLEVCDANDQNQHWLKIDAGNGHYRLEKRGTNFSLDGGGGGAIDQNVYLWTSNSSNQNQQWRFDNASSSRTIDGDIEDELAQKSALKIYPNPIVTDALTIEMENGVYNQFSIYNVSGSVVKQGELDDDMSQLQIDFSGLDRGVYALLLRGATTYTTVKVIKE